MKWHYLQRWHDLLCCKHGNYSTPQTQNASHSSFEVVKEASQALDFTGFSDSQFIHYLEQVDFGTPFPGKAENPVFMRSAGISAAGGNLVKYRNLVLFLKKML